MVHRNGAAPHGIHYVVMVYPDVEAVQETEMYFLPELMPGNPHSANPLAWGGTLLLCFTGMRMTQLLEKVTFDACEMWNEIQPMINGLMGTLQMSAVLDGRSSAIFLKNKFI